MNLPNSDQYLFQNNEKFELVLKGTSSGVYEMNLTDGSCWWSSRFYELLGFEVNDIKPSKDILLNQLVSPEDRDKLAKICEIHSTTDDPFLIEIQFKHQSGVYRWFKLSGQSKWENGKALYLIGSLTDIEDRISVQLENSRNQFLLEEAGFMAKVGGWELLLDSAFVFWSKEVCLIHEMPENYKPSLDEAINFYSKSSIPVIQEAVGEALSKGTSFDLELKIITANQKKVWVRAIGKPIYDGHKNKIIGLRGVFQDIDGQKEKELAFKGTVDFIHEQNKRLFNFAQIVSHNLGSHASNLQLTLDLLNAETSPAEIAHLKNNLRKISESLNQTISHLNDIVVIQTETANIKKKVSFEKVFQSTLSTLKTEIEQEKVEIEADFNRSTDIEYIPAYLESILLNLISNAIKYRNPKKQLKIVVTSFMDNGKPVLEVKDNGLGMDLKRYGDKLFGMYKTFHDNPKARGIGLFITKSQVEAMGGKITAESVIGEGSTFKISF